MTGVDIRARRGGFALAAAFTPATRGCTAVFGASGAGKSTLLAAIAGAVRPEAGRISIGDAVLFDAAAGIDVPMQARGLGMVFQDARLFPHMSVADNLAYGARRAGDRPGPGRDDVLDVLGIGDLLARRPAGLSGGERQRVALGRALMARPRLLLLDEPMAALDAPRRAEILALLERIGAAFALPMLLVTHDLGEVVRLADHMVVLDAGRTLAEGPPGALTLRGDLPALSGPDAIGAVLDGTVVQTGGDGALVALGDDGPRLEVGPQDRAAGAPVRLWIAARDVALALAPPQDLSIRNCLAATVTGRTDRSDGRSLIHLQLSGGPGLASLVSQAAARALNLQAGRMVYALVKAVAVRGQP
jgi:molybdate transport system ATP-binding protein